MTNYYVTYSFSDENARRKFYEEVKAEKIPEKSREEKGCIRYAYFLDADSDNKMFLWEQWESRDAQKLHTQQPHFEALSKIKEKYVLDTEILVEDQYCR